MPHGGMSLAGQRKPLLGEFRSGGRRELSLLPRIELVDGLGEHQQSHPGVLRPAVLGAGASVLATRVRAHPEKVGMARHSVDLARELWDPEVVNHVCRLELDELMAPV